MEYSCKCPQYCLRFLSYALKRSITFFRMHSLNILFITKQNPIQHLTANSICVQYERKSRPTYFLSFPFPALIFAMARQIPIKAPPITQIQNAAPKAFAKIMRTKTISTISITGIILIFKYSYHWKSHAIVCDRASRLTMTSLAQKHLSVVQFHLFYQRNSYIFSCIANIMFFKNNAETPATLSSQVSSHFFYDEIKYALTLPLIISTARANGSLTRLS